MIKAGIVGHRFFRDQEVEAFVSFQCRNILVSIMKEYEVTAISAIAEGADSIFAETALSLKIPLEIVRPFDTYISDFVTDHSRNSYARLREAALKETRLDYLIRSEDAYYEAMKHVVEYSDLLIAVWDCMPARGKGGTGAAVKLAIDLGKDWIHMNVVDLTTTFNYSKDLKNLFV